jgi:hypothetical protein
MFVRVLCPWAGFESFRISETFVLSEHMTYLMIVEGEDFFPLALQPNSGLGRSMKLSVSLQLLDLRQP